MLNVLSALGASDLQETQTGVRSLVEVLGPVEGTKTLCVASLQHFTAVARGAGGQYPEEGKRRVWFRLHYLKRVYEHLRVKNGSAAAEAAVEEIIRASTLQFIGQMIPSPDRFSRSFVLNGVWQHLLARDYNIAGEVMPPKGNSVTLRVRRCFYNEVCRDLDLLPIAHQLCNGDFLFWNDYHPNVRFSRTKTLVAGDDRCDHTLTWVEETNLSVSP